MCLWRLSKFEAEQLVNASGSLFLEWNGNHEPAHHLVFLKVLLGAVRVGIVTVHSSVADCAVSVHGLKVGIVTKLYRSGGGSFRMFPYRD